MHCSIFARRSMAVYVVFLRLGHRNEPMISLLSKHTCLYSSYDHEVNLDKIEM